MYNCRMVGATTNNTMRFTTHRALCLVRACRHSHTNNFVFGRRVPKRCRSILISISAPTNRGTGGSTLLRPSPGVWE